MHRKGLLLAVVVLSLASSEALAFWPFSGGRSKEAPASVEAAAPAGLTLEEAYRLALKRSEDIAISQSAVDEAQGEFYRSLNVIMPSVHFVMSRSYQDAPKDAGSTDGISSNATRPNTPMKRFTFSQPIFSGFKEIATLQASGAGKAQRRFEKQRAEHLLFINVTESFYAVLQSRRDAALLTETQNALAERVKELEERARVGRSRDTEIEQARAELKVVAADLLESERVREVSRQLLEFYIGKSAEGELVEDEPTDTEEPSLSYYLARANDRPDVKAYESAYELASKNVVVAQSGLFPSISAEGNYYTHRVGFQSGNDWDTTVTMDVPVFEGTEVIGDIKVAHAGRQKAEAELAKARRSAVLDIQSTHQNYLYTRKRSLALAEASQALRRTVEIQKEDYKLNLVSNLDVLDSIRRSNDVARTANAAHFEAKAYLWSLKVAGGQTILTGAGE